jgi:hypothetical protein
MLNILCSVLVELCLCDFLTLFEVIVVADQFIKSICESVERSMASLMFQFQSKENRQRLIKLLIEILRENSSSTFQILMMDHVNVLM